MKTEINLKANVLYFRSETELEESWAALVNKTVDLSEYDFKKVERAIINEKIFFRTDVRVEKTSKLIGHFYGRPTKAQIARNTVVTETEIKEDIYKYRVNLLDYIGATAYTDYGKLTINLINLQGGSNTAKGFLSLLTSNLALL